ncbi:MAG: hypothetical protein WBA63_00115 [Thermomicrobiales bacterium]
MASPASSSRPNTAPDSPLSRPIGYWLKRLDRAIDERFARELKRVDLGRRDWQVLHTIAKGPVAPEEVEAALTPFWIPGAVTWPETRDALLHRGLIREEGTKLHLTPEGELVHADLFAAVGDTRHRLMDGIPDEDYVRTIETLAMMAANVERL